MLDYSHRYVQWCLTSPAAPCLLSQSQSGLEPATSALCRLKVELVCKPEFSRWTLTLILQPAVETGTLTLNTSVMSSFFLDLDLKMLQLTVVHETGPWTCFRWSISFSSLELLFQCFRSQHVVVAALSVCLFLFWIHQLLTLVAF